ncbi:hypothetical protein SAMN05216582_1326 [Selenomonas ruminantium]|uniref:Uncharacterized protein n=1 Tax=Selenomonas ruminantium TaxID=971 RepID=A0A1M6X5Y8_SELRU|nr:hypothetical protein SAMN05216582_1326 [Selenomonas ruminantium]
MVLWGNDLEIIENEIIWYKEVHALAFVWKQEMMANMAK